MSTYGLSTNYKDITGNRYSKLLVIKRITNIGEPRIKFLCKCDCGNETIVLGQNLRSGTTKSCGCLNIELFKKRVAIINTNHSNSKVGKVTVEYRTWQSIKERCLNISSKSYKYYGGRGIKMFEGWVNDFDSFLKYMGKRPSKIHSIDRFPNMNGNYEPNNVRWATPKQQGENTRKVVNLTYNNITMNLSDWGRYFKVKPEAIRFHLKKGRSINQIAYHYEQKLNLKSTKWLAQVD